MKGGLIIYQKPPYHLKLKIIYQTQFKLSNAIKTPYIVNAGIIPNSDFVATVINLNENEALYFNDAKIASKGKWNNKS